MKTLSSIIIFNVLMIAFASCNSKTVSNVENKNLSPSIRIWKDVAYANISAAQKLDIFLPDSGNGPFPAVIWIHGGAFKMGNKDNPQSLNALKSAGFAVVSINYRLSSEAKWPAQLEDLKSVVRFLKSNAGQYFLNSDKIASWGASAGGHLSSMMGIALSTDSATKIQASVDWFGPVDFFHMDEDIISTGVKRATLPNGDANSPESELIGAVVKQNHALSDSASPVIWVGKPEIKDIPPFLIMHGAKDQLIGYPQSERLHKAIQNKFGAAKSNYFLLPDGTHGGGDFDLPETEKMVIDFLNFNLKR